MITGEFPGQDPDVSEEPALLDGDSVAAPGAQPGERVARAHGSAQQRLRCLVDTEYAFVWRTLRRLGVPRSEVDDAVQEVFLVTARKLETILQGGERNYLFGIVLRVASSRRRGIARRREVVPDDSWEALAGVPTPEELVDQKRARELLECILLDMTEECRAVFVLFELEGLDSREIARLLRIPPGTVASRVRRAREQFRDRVRRIQARLAFEESGRD